MGITVKQAVANGACKPVVEYVLKRAGLKELPDLEVLLSRHTERPTVKAGDVAVLDDLDVLDFEGIPQQLVEPIRKELSGFVENQLHPKLAPLMMSRVFDIGMKILKDGLVKQVEIGRLEAESDDTLGYEFQTPSGRHRTTFFRLVYGTEAQIPYEIQNYKSKLDARQAAETANSGNRKVDKVEKSAHRLDERFELQESADEVLEQCASGKKQDKMDVVRLWLLYPEKYDLPNLEIPFPIRRTQGKSGDYRTQPVESVIRLFEGVLGGKSLNGLGWPILQERVRHGATLLRDYHDHILSLLEEGQMAVDWLPPGARKDELQKRVNDGRRSLYATMLSSEMFESLGVVAYDALYVLPGKPLTERYFVDTSTIRYWAERFAKASLHGFYNFGPLSKSVGIRNNGKLMLYARGLAHFEKKDDVKYSHENSKGKDGITAELTKMSYTAVDDWKNYFKATKAGNPKDAKVRLPWDEELRMAKRAAKTAKKAA